jgi:N-acetylmuramic acid 6-phosphate etherase
MSLPQLDENRDKPLQTEAENPRSACMDTGSTLEMLTLMNQEDHQVAVAVQQALPSIAVVVDVIAAALQAGGRLFYLGAGTSGRLGVLDASECPPTFSTAPEMVQGIIAGGDTALRWAVEGAEDDGELGKQDVIHHNIKQGDVMVGISASGNPAYVVEALALAKQRGIETVALTCNPDAQALKVATYGIVVQVGAEVLAGSSRLKAGTAQKLVLNMLTTGAMVRMGYTFGNLMVNVKASNIKLRQRAMRLVQRIIQCDEATATQALEECQWDVKLACILALSLAHNPAEAACLLSQHGENLRRVLSLNTALGEGS